MAGLEPITGAPVETSTESWWSGAVDWIKDKSADLLNVGVDAAKSGITARLKNEIAGGGTGAGGSVPAYNPQTNALSPDLALISPNDSGVFYDSYGRPYLRTDAANRTGIIPGLKLSSTGGQQDRLELLPSGVNLGNMGPIVLIGAGILTLWLLSRGH